MRTTHRALIIASLLLVPTLGHADGWYVGAGGGGSAVGGQLGNTFRTTEDGQDAVHNLRDGRSAGARLVLGRRVGPWAVEGFFTSVPLGNNDRTELATGSLGADLKYHVRVVSLLDLYVRGGVHAASVMGLERDRHHCGCDSGSEQDGPLLEGRGVDYGVGIQVPFPVGSTNVALWFDLGRERASLRYRDAEQGMDADITTAFLGISVGSGL